MEQYENENIPAQIRGRKLDFTKEWIVNDTSSLKVVFSRTRDWLLNTSDWPV